MDVSETFYRLDKDCFQYNSTDPANLTHPLISRKQYAAMPNECTEFRTFLTEVVCRAFGELAFQKDNLHNCLRPKFDKPIGQMVQVLMDMITQVCASEHYSEQLTFTVEEYIRIGDLAELLLHLTEPTKVNKNWNSHAAHAAASICTLASLVTMVEYGPQKNWRQEAITGCHLTGGSYGSPDSTYLEYMVIGEEEDVQGARTSYLDKERFWVEKHDKAVRAVFAERLPDKDYPAPRPTRAQTFDFCAKKAGAHVLDGENKVDSTGIDTLVMNAVSQLAYCPTALAMHTSSKCITLLKMCLDDRQKEVRVTRQDFTRYHLSTQYCPADLHHEDPAVRDPPFPIERLKVPPVWWSILRSHVRLYINAIFECIDTLAHEFEIIDVDRILARQQEAHREGYNQEPFFIAGTHVGREIPAQERFVYCPQTMERYSEVAARNHSRMCMTSIRNTLERSGNDMSEDLRKELRALMHHHSRKCDGDK